MQTLLHGLQDQTHPPECREKTIGIHRPCPALAKVRNLPAGEVQQAKTGEIDLGPALRAIDHQNEAAGDPTSGADAYRLAYCPNRVALRKYSLHRLRTGSGAAEASASPPLSG